MNRGGQSEPVVQLVTLALGAEIFAIPVDPVEEIVAMRPLFSVPEAPPYLAGLIDVRGQAVPVIDLRRKLGLPAAEPTHDTRIIVLRIPVAGRNPLIGLVADRVIEVIAQAASEIGPAPEIGQRWNSGFIAGVVCRPSGFVVIFDLARLFSGAEAASLAPHDGTVQEGPGGLLAVA